MACAQQSVESREHSFVAGPRGSTGEEQVLRDDNNDNKKTMADIQSVLPRCRARV